MLTRNQICHDLAMEYVRFSSLHPQLIPNGDKIPIMPGTNADPKILIAQYYKTAFSWFNDNFQTYIGTEVTDKMGWDKE